jgi:hypothetical protein
MARPQHALIIKLYYDLSPAMVTAMRETAVLKEEVKQAIDGVLLMLK